MATGDDSEKRRPPPGDFAAHAALVDAENVEAQEREAKQGCGCPPGSILADCPDIRPFTGLQCDGRVPRSMLTSNAAELVQCEVRIKGATDTREHRRSLILRAEALGWQAIHVDGASLQFCPNHRDPDRERIRRLR